jgi:hypothetical protein
VPRSAIERGFLGAKRDGSTPHNNINAKRTSKTGTFLETNSSPPGCPGLGCWRFPPPSCLPAHACQFSRSPPKTLVDGSGYFPRRRAAHGTLSIGTSQRLCRAPRVAGGRLRSGRNLLPAPVRAPGHPVLARRGRPHPPKREVETRPHGPGRFGQRVLPVLLRRAAHQQ